jgi:hypothetical protein
MYLGVSLYLACATFLFYVVVMHFKKVEQVISSDLVTVGHLVLVVGMVHNFLLNVLVASVVFLDAPREFTTTGRLDRYWQPEGDSWRKRLALFIRHRLDPFDPRGIHS